MQFLLQDCPRSFSLNWKSNGLFFRRTHNQAHNLSANKPVGFLLFVRSLLDDIIFDGPHRRNLPGPMVSLSLSGLYRSPSDAVGSEPWRRGDVAPQHTAKGKRAQKEEGIIRIRRAWLWMGLRVVDQTTQL